jgi:hypothetical protein
MRSLTMRQLFCVLSLVTLVGAACDNGAAPCSSSADCAAGEVCFAGLCEPTVPVADGGQTPGDAGGEGQDAGASVDAGAALADAGEATADTGVPVDCDRDNDGFAGPQCGGPDCDDDARAAHPGGVEVCSFHDENCEDGNNEGLTCEFFASSSDTLYRIDPFAETVVEVGSLRLPGGMTGGILDLDIDSDGGLVGVTNSGLFTFDQNGEGSLLANVDVPERTNGMAIDSFGKIFLTQGVSDRDSFAYTVNRETGQVSTVGALSPYRSSGDCVVLKDDSLLMSARGEDGSDLLVYIDSQSAQTRVIGDIGFPGVYGLSASWNGLFGVTDAGKVLVIDPDTGAGRLLFEQADTRFWGAANGD